MRIHRLLLTDVKGVSEREIVFPPSGVVVVEGDNEAGKTTMIEALDLLFQEKDSSKKRHVLAMRPVGLDVPSVIEAEISTGPYRFVYRKQWFRKPGTVLTVLEPRREDLTGSAAHDRVLGILEETTDASLWHALRLLQATPLTSTDFSGSSALADALEQAAGSAADSAGTAGDSLLSAAEEAYREFFTATGRPTGEYRDAQVRVEEAEAARDAAAAAVREVADDVVRHTEAVHELARWESQLAVQEQALEELVVENDAAAEVVREAQRVALEVRVAQAAVDAASERGRRREELESAVAAAQARLEEVTARHADLQQQGEPARAAVEAAEAAAREAADARARARRLASRAESDVALVSDLQDLGEVLERLDRAGGAARRHRAAVRDAAAARFAGDLSAIEAAARDLEVARVAWRAGHATWSLTRHGAEPVLIDGHEVRDATEASGVLEAPLQIEVPGHLTLRIDPAETVDRQARDLARAESRLADLLADAGVDDVEGARAAAARHDDAQRALSEAERALSAAAAGESVEAARARADTLLAHVRELVGARVEEAQAHAGADGTHPEPADATQPGPADATQPGPADATRPGPADATRPGPADGTRPGPVDGTRPIPDAVLAFVQVGPRPDGPAPVEAPAHTEIEAEAGVEVEAEAGVGVADEPDGRPAPGVIDEVVAWITGGEPCEPVPVRRLRTLATQARAAEDAADAAIAGAEADLTHRRRDLETHTAALTRAAIEAENAQSLLDDARARLDADRARLDDEASARQVSTARDALTSALAAQAEVTARVEALDPDSVTVRLAGARSAVETIRRRHTRAREDRIAIEARLRHAGEQGRAEALAEAETALARAQRTYAAASRRAEAARLLFETLTRHRAQVTRTYVEPFGKAVSRLGRVVYGPGFDVEVGEDLTIEARVLDDRRIPFDALSSGAKEQLGILTRLAAASLVDPAHGAPVILDDALGYSDPTRLQRLCSAFSLVGDEAQIILLTCTPGRYAAVPNTHLIRLDSVGSRG